ncbi:thiamine ABC transporter substrate-binding protein [Sanguibacter antarcticus]|uniref:Thiamine transport system substrate-binding protein n=1 Tax=Sanguibacter antarcticus TaxID=372484 RepID=A0A2A9E874_9MICO|nr:thiamine ABC transporter substrate-binding protein [Sanguibacter antarcticus]PFG34422.1 thiamine transport system substrate-binding protein [Sanguibacter antarcticus]
MLNTLHQPARHRSGRAGLAVVGLTTSLALGLVSCASGSTQDDATDEASGTVTVVVHDSIVISDESKAAFEDESGLTLEVVSAGDGGALANQLILTKDSPLGDVAYGIDNSFASRAVAEGVFAPYTSPVQGELSAQLAADPSGTLTAIDYGDVCMNVDTAWFEENGELEPETLEDLTTAEYKDLTVVSNPATSSPGLAFLFATIGEYGDDYLDYWERLADNGLLVVNGWEEAYQTEFTAGEGAGARPIVLSYGSSPAYTVSEDGSTTTTTAMLDTCFRQVEYAGVLEGAENPEGAQELVDFLLGEPFQSEIPTGMYVYPVDPDAVVPPEWVDFAPLPTNPIVLDPAEISENRDTWIKEWTATVLG